MIQSAETRLDGNMLIVRIPVRFHRRGGRKRIVAPDGSATVPATNHSLLLKRLERPLPTSWGEQRETQRSPRWTK